MADGHTLQVGLDLVSLVVDHSLHTASAVRALRDDDCSRHPLAHHPQPLPNPRLHLGDRGVLAGLPDHQRTVHHVDPGWDIECAAEVLGRYRVGRPQTKALP